MEKEIVCLNEKNKNGDTNNIKDLNRLAILHFGTSDTFDVILNLILNNSHDDNIINVS